MYVPEALAATVYLNMHLADTMGDLTATQAGLMPLFKQTRDGVPSRCWLMPLSTTTLETCRGGSWHP